MNGSAALTGNDDVILNRRIFANYGTGDVANLEFPNNLVEAKAGKNGNVIYAFNSTGKLCNVTLKVLIGSADDKYLNSLMTLYLNDPSSFILIVGEFIKRVGDGKGNVSSIIYSFSGGIISKIPIGKDNVEGDTEQGMSVWMLTFANTDRLIA
jgi:hypothetical protein